MSKKEKDRITKEQLHKLKVGNERESQIDQGYFDGRFRERVEKPKKSYKRKPKHKNNDWE
jgi:stalled ribosome alternative rescue factor ArfA